MAIPSERLVPMQLLELKKEDRLTFRQIAEGIGSTVRSTQRYCEGERLPDRARMRRLVIFSEGRVTPNDIYGLSDLIAECLERRAQRLQAKKAKREPHPELPFEAAA